MNIWKMFTIPIGIIRNENVSRLDISDKSNKKYVKLPFYAVYTKDLILNSN